jgi:hypothetical protein
MAPAGRVALIARSTRWQIRAGAPVVDAVLISLADRFVPGRLQECRPARAGGLLSHPGLPRETLVLNLTR